MLGLISASPSSPIIETSPVRLYCTVLVLATHMLTEQMCHNSVKGYTHTHTECWFIDEKAAADDGAICIKASSQSLKCHFWLLEMTVHSYASAWWSLWTKANVLTTSSSLIKAHLPQLSHYTSAHWNFVHCFISYWLHHCCRGVLRRLHYRLIHSLLLALSANTVYRAS